MVRDFENIDFSLLMSEVKKDERENPIDLKSELPKSNEISYDEDTADFTHLCIRDTVRV